MKKIWIIGGGQFGLRSAQWLVHTSEKCHITLVDRQDEVLRKAVSLGCTVEADDGVLFLLKNLTEHGSLPDWIIPAVPLHLAWQWCRLALGDQHVRPCPFPQDIQKMLPHPMKGSNGDIYVSHADFLCPPGCNEPDGKCTMTGQPRKPDMFRLLAELHSTTLCAHVIRSVQLGTGTGGYTPQALFSIKDEISRCTGRFFLATACRCHGVISTGEKI